MTPSAKSAIDKILVRGTNWIGDAVMTMPAVQRLREFRRDAHITLLCPAKIHDLWRHNPFLNEVVAETGDRPFDLAVIFPNSFRSAWECRRAPIRVGFAGHWRRRLLTHIVEEPRGEQPVYEKLTVAGKRFRRKVFPVIRHQAHRYLDLVSFLGGNRELVQPKIWLAPGELPAMTKFFREDARPLFGLNAGAEYGPAKRWLPERFAEAARRVAEEVDCRWVLLGGPGDVGMAGQIAGEIPGAINLAGQTTLLELCEVMKCCRLVLTNDTGPMHLAAALGTPLVAIFGSTSPELTGPLGPHVSIVRAEVECTPCFLRQCPIDFRCMTGITVEQVTAAVLKLWEQTEKSHGHA